MLTRNNCRLCGGDVEVKLTLKPTPIANNFTSEPNQGELYPLELVECADCGHVQNHHVFSGLYDNYKFRTPSANKARLQATARALHERFPDATKVVEIGSNNGLYLHVLQQEFGSVVGVDPSGEWPVWPHEFNLDVAKRIEKRLGRPDLIVANNVFAHVDDLDTMFEAASYLCDNLVFEVQYFGTMVERGIYDTIYHEHFDQHTIQPLFGFLLKHGFVMAEYELFDALGGSVRVYADKGTAGMAMLDKVNWDKYSTKILENQADLLNRLPDRFSLWGAPAKATTLIWQLGIQDRIAYCVDNTPEKQGLYLPGTSIEIVPDFLDDLPTVLAAWNYDLGGEDVIRPYRFRS